MSKLQFDLEIIHKIDESKEISKEEILELSESAPRKIIFDTASRIRDKQKGRNVSFSKKAFFNIINLCRDTCSYCTYKAEPNDAKLSLMNKQTVKELAVLAKKYNCTEALFVTGERPEQKYSEAKKWLRNEGFSSTSEYLIHCSEMVLDEGIFPHTNAGNLTKSEMKELQKSNVSMGVMLENSSPRLREKGMPHHDAPSKDPIARLNILKNSGELKIPMTTGILVGIGENMEECIQSILDIKELHAKYGNIQEIILQNFHPKPETSMFQHSTPEEDYFKTIVALCRIIMPDANIQIPPNLSPENYQEFLSVGINDWGGISPITSDYVNPEFSWPNIQNVEKKCNDSGFSFKARFPVYPEFISLVNNDLKQRISLIADEENYVKESYWK
ncbi:MAG: 7,8-didemethyl-8-hydroxy-5-deazariboflavin synthase subunit CofG [Crenarchaeota archaeon]|nr:7,8-didemethyl-8-hydroxy-5-deazariboflavin synthase subunit CofG [Thermoproteota archaeon]MDA1124236.1 7,8-didemethyl-8-hydroxy-5-deazariboflavin synthase subunit CofG [Thermoproteota archaeon]